MELSVDLIKITRIPYHELETVYISANLAIIPNGHHVQTNVSNGNKSVKFTPHRFSFLIDQDPSNSDLSLVITVFTHLTNSNKQAISYVTIPINSIPYRKISQASLSTTLLSTYSVSPIVKISLGINLTDPSSQFRNWPHCDLQHPNAVSVVDYDSFENAPIIELDCFGRLKPPEHYIEKCKELIEDNSELFMNFILNDSLRKFVLQKAFDNYQDNDYVLLTSIGSSGQQSQSSNISKQNSIKNPKKIQKNKPHTKNLDHPPQPPNETSQPTQPPTEQTPNPRRQIRNDEQLEVPPIDVNIVGQQHIPQQSFSPNSEANNDSQAIKTQVWTVSLLKKQQQNAQLKQNQYQQQYPYVQQQQQPQATPQNHQGPQVPQISKNETPTKPFIHLRTKPQPFTEMEKQKQLSIFKSPPVRGLLQQKSGPAAEDKKPIGQTNKKNRSICVAPKQISKQTSQGQVDDIPRNDSQSLSATASPTTMQPPNGFERRAMKKPKPPQMQGQLMASQPPNGNDNGISLRRLRQSSEY
ncbi:hypothetical protein M9Y10_039204 [Tritrichomonas musculus]|uniref:C2 NT-type domain-containing protein n=1 Tax=Tritrichomonas musculus TaxID=1915356 RepID=A0ABR2GL49_9EUKA